MARIADMMTDPRDDFQKLKRVECRRILEKCDIKHDPRITQQDAVKLLQANKIDPRTSIEWENIYLTDPNGNQKVHSEPKRVEPNRPENYDELALAEVERKSLEAIERDKKDKEKVKSLESEVSDLKEMVARLLDERKMETVETPVKVVVHKETDPYKMKFMAQRKWLKENGVELNKGDNPKLLIKSVLEKGIENPA